MASSSCVRLWCHRCTRCFVLHSTVASRASHVSAQVQRCSTAFSVTGLSAVSGRHAAAPPPPLPPHARHRWKRLYSGDVRTAGKPLSSPAQARDGQENTVAEPWRDTDAVAAPPYQNQNPSSSQNQNPSSSQNQYQNQNPSSSQPTATARETALHLGTRPQLPGLLEETRDEETISTSRPQEETRDEEYGSIVVSSDLPPLTSHSLVSYVDKSETLSRLVHLGVNLRGLEQRANVGTMLLRLDFQTDVAPRLLFLRDLGVEESGLGRLLSKNPFILTESLENLSTRVNYLLSRKFSSQAVASMVVRAPYLLNFSVKRLDNRLAFFQQQLGLSPDNTRDVVARLPRLLCGSLEPIKETLKVCKVEFGFKDNEVQHIILAVPKVLTANKKKLSQIFDYVHNTMHVPHHLIVKFPQVLNCKFLRMQERHLFLQYLSKAQYDPGQPGYVALDRLAATPDHVFCSQVASATPDDFYLFQKTL